MSRKKDILLDIYFHRILAFIALMPPRLAYSLLCPVGHLFRDWDSYQAWIDPGALRRASLNLSRAYAIPNSKIRSALKDYLCFETRFVLENFWIRELNTRNILKAFSHHDVKRLGEYLKNGPYVIVTVHTSAILMIVALLDTLGHRSPLVAANAMRQSWDSATPLQRSMIKTWEAWMKHQTLLFVGESDVLQKGREAIRSGQSVVIAQDLPANSNRGVQVKMFGRDIWMPVGSVKLAWDTGVKMLLTVGRASKCFDLYNLYFREIIPTGNFESDVQSLCTGIEESVRPNPSCWAGWLYLDKMEEG